MESAAENSLPEELLIERLRKQRDELLDMVRLRLATVAALIGGDWQRLTAFLSAVEVESLQRLESEMQPRLRAPMASTERDRAVRQALVE